MTTRLTSVTVENFRGFRDRRTLSLDADVILVRGDNGGGKTSLTDAIMWNIMGQLTHLTDRVRGLRQTHDPIRNLYSASPCLVSLSIRTESGEWTLKRTGDARSSTMTVSLNERVVGGEEVLPRVFGEESLDSLRSAVSTWGFLRQDAIRSVLDTGGVALHERMSSVIGLADVSRFRDACRAEVKNRSAERRELASAVNTARQATETARQRLVANDRASSLPRLTIEERLSALPSVAGVALSTAGLHGLDELAELGRQVGSTIETVAAGADAYDRLVRTQSLLSRSSGTLREELAAAESRAEELERQAPPAQQLAQAALQLLGDHCPVCDQEIDTELVRQKLHRDLDRQARRVVAAVEARDIAQALRRDLAEAEGFERQQSQAAHELDAQLGEVASKITSLSRMNVDASLSRPQGLRALIGRLDELRTSLRRVYVEARAESEANELTLAAALEAAEGQENLVSAAFDVADRREVAAKELEGAAQVSAERIVAASLTTLEPSFTEVFDRLSPHPTFSRLRARQDVYYNKNQIVPEVVDELRGVVANPLLVYSEGQLNTVALSYFLGLALSSSTDSVGFMVLDDPLQSMDVLAVLGFSDLCRRLRGQRQILLTTHDRRFADLLARKLAPREPDQSTILFSFEDWSIAGPQVMVQRSDFSSGPFDGLAMIR